MYIVQHHRVDIGQWLGLHIARPVMFSIIKLTPTQWLLSNEGPAFILLFCYFSSLIMLGPKFTGSVTDNDTTFFNIIAFQEF